jgi:Tectonin domain
MGGSLRVKKRLLYLFALFASTAVLQGCGGGGARVATTAPPAALLPTAKSVSPGSIPAPPMTSARGSLTSMSAKRQARGFIQPASWTQLPGGAVSTAIAPDGSVWALGLDGLSTGDHFIYHYAGGTWTSSPGAASRLAIAPDGTPWAVNAAGGIYSYRNGSWNPLAGGASDISVAADNTILVISNQPGGIYGNGIWHYTGSAWEQEPGAGVRIALSRDTGTYPGGFNPYGWYIVNAQHSIYYYSPGVGYVQVPGAASMVAPTNNGGLFALGVPDASGAGYVYHMDLVSKTWVQQPGAATTISTDGSVAYATGASGGLYSSPVTPGSAPNTGAPVVGYLAPTGTGSFAGQLTAVTSGATVVGISTTEVPDTGSTALSSGNLAFNLGSSVLSAARRPAARHVDAPSGPRPDIDGPTEGPAEMAKLESHLRRATSGPRQLLSLRRTQALPTAQGSQNSFWTSIFAIGSNSSTDVQVPATLQAVANNGYVWVDNTLNLDAATAAKLAADLDNAYASDTAHYGPTQFTANAVGITNHANWESCDSTGTMIPGPGVARYVVPPDAKINVLVLNTANLGSGVGGYFTTTNYYYQTAWNCLIGQSDGNGGTYTATTIPHSNEAPLIYIGWQTKNSTDFETDEDAVRGTAHELQHLINFVNHVALNDGAVEKRWINEGMSMLAQDFAVNRKFSSLPHDSWDALYRASQYTSAPQNFSLTSFTGIDPNKSTLAYNCSGCYGASYLFQRYLYDRFGGDAFLRSMLGSTTSYTALQSATGVDPHTLISDFAIALAASGSNATTDPRFGIPSLNLLTAYPDQFGTSQVVGSPAISGLPSSAAPYVGSFSYYSVGANALNQNLSGKDMGGGFGLQIGVVQR